MKLFKSTVAFVLTLSLVFGGYTFYSKDNSTVKGYDGYTLAWSDEFNGTSLDRSVWNVEDNGFGGWNNELQYYRDSSNNIQVSDGTLKLIAKKEDYKNMGYTSARINSENKVKLGYGKIEARIKLPIFKGTFPAFWLMGNNGKIWPHCGEIDIMEAVNTENIAYGTAHWPQHVNVLENDEIFSESGGTYGWKLDMTQFHVYGIERTETSISWYVDGKTYFTLPITDDPNMAPLKLDAYILLNLAVGGDWPGFEIDDTAFPATMEVDYVKYYTKDASTPTTQAPTTKPIATTQAPTTKPAVTTTQASIPSGYTACTPDVKTNLGKWTYLVCNSWLGSEAYYKGGSELNNVGLFVKKAGGQNWGTQLMTNPISITNNHTYRYTITVNSDKAGASVLLKDDTNDKDLQTKTLVAGDNVYTGTFTVNNDSVNFIFDLGLLADNTTFKVTSFTLEDTTPVTTQAPTTKPVVTTTQVPTTKPVVTTTQVPTTKPVVTTTQVPTTKPVVTTTQVSTTKPVTTTTQVPTSKVQDTTASTTTVANTDLTTTEAVTTVEVSSTNVETASDVKVETTKPATSDSQIFIGKGKIKKVKNIKKKSVTLKIKKLSGAKRYKVKYSTNRKLKNAKYKTVKKLKFVIKKLKVGKTYYFKVRGINGKITGKWSKAKKIKIKK